MSKLQPVTQHTWESNMSNSHLLLLGLFIATMPNVAAAQCPQARPMYQDLEAWMHSGVQFRHHIQAQITMINPASADGSHYFTSWSKGCIFNGVSPYGQCYLTTNPSLAVLYSDRTDPAEKGMNQPFSIKKYDQQVVAIDMVNNRIVMKALTWKFETTYTNVSRTGNVIVGSTTDGAVIIINILKLDSSPISCSNF
jgi:hypothetical protein